MKDNVTMWLPRYLHKQLKLAAVNDEREIGAMLIDAVVEYLDRRWHPSFTAARAGSDKIAGTDGGAE